MKKILSVILVNIVFFNFGYSQECTIDTGNSGGNINVCDECTPNCSDGELVGLDISTGTQLDTVFFNTTLLIDGNLSITPSNNNVFVIPSGVTITISGDLNFIGNNSPKDFVVNGQLVVAGNMDLDDQQIEINGSGSIEAGSISGASKSTCENDADCPSFTVEGGCTGGGLCTEEALPIELKSFDASKSGKNINLDWVTAKEENFSHFEVERSLDQENWEQIGLVQGMGESMSDVHYDFTDRNAPFGVIYYRLNAVDIDASFEYSPVVKIEVGFEGKLAVSPNPVKDAANLKIQVPSEFRDNLAYVGLFDLSGVKVQEFRNFDTDGTLQMNQKLKSGMYILKVNHNGLQENIRVIIQ